MSEISFNIYGMKLDKGYFPSWKVSKNLVSKVTQIVPYLYRVQIVYCQICTYTVWFSLVCAHFWNKIETFQCKSHWTFLIFWDQLKMMSGLNMYRRKNAWFCFLFIVCVHSSHKTEKFCFWKSWKYFNSFW